MEGDGDIEERELMVGRGGRGCFLEGSGCIGGGGDGLGGRGEVLA